MNGNYVFTTNIIKKNLPSFIKTNMERAMDKKNKRTKSPLKLNAFSLNNEFDYGIHNPKKFLSLSNERENQIKNQDKIKYNFQKKQEKMGDEQVADKTKLMEGLKIPSGLLSNPKDNFDVPAYKEQIKRLHGIVRPVNNKRAEILNIPEQNKSFLDKVKKEKYTDYETFLNNPHMKKLNEFYEKINYELEHNRKLSPRQIEELKTESIHIEDELYHYLQKLNEFELAELNTNPYKTEEEHKRTDDLISITRSRIDKLLLKNNEPESEGMNENKMRQLESYLDVAKNQLLVLNRNPAKFRKEIRNVNMLKDALLQDLKRRKIFLPRKIVLPIKRRY